MTAWLLTLGLLVLAALLGAAKALNRDMTRLRVVISGAGAAGASPGSTINVCNRASARLPDGWPLRFLISAFDSTRMRRVASSCMPGAHNCVASSGSDGSEQRGSASQARPAFAHISSLRR